MYKKWTVDEIKKVIDDLALKWSFPCSIPIEVSTRAKKRLGAFFYKNIDNKIIPLKFVFAYDLLNGKYDENIVEEVIIHEYLHYYCDVKTNKSNGHNIYFKEMCIKNNISTKATMNNNNIDLKNKYKIYCSNCSKLVCVHIRKDAAERKVNKYISTCCRAKLICDI